MNLHPWLPASAGSSPRAAIFLSGGGSNAEQILKGMAADRAAGISVPFEVAVLVTDAPETSRARELSQIYHLPLIEEDIRKFYHDRGETRVSIATPRGLEVREEWTNVLRAKLAPFGIAFGIFAGFVPLTNLTDDFPCLNVHPGDLTYRENGERHLVGLHEIPIERAILAGLDYLRSSVILATRVVSGGGGMDAGPLLGISAPMPMEVTPDQLSEFRKLAAVRPAKRPVGGYHDALEEFASAQQERLKVAGDWVVFYPVIRDFADDRFYYDEKNGQLFFRAGNGRFHPIETVQYSADGSREILFDETSGE